MENFEEGLALRKEGRIELREYQIKIAESILKKGNTLVVMPTALGKTFVAVLIMAKMLQEMKEGKRENRKFLFLTPTKPLATQQAERITELVDFGGEKEGEVEGKVEAEKKDEIESKVETEKEGGKEEGTEGIDKGNGEIEQISDVVVLTGEKKPKEREKIWQDERVKVVCATPQTVEYDLLAGRMELEKFALVVFDEAHRVVKDYSYSFLARESAKLQHVMLIGLTASPSSKKETIDEICKNMSVKNIEIRDENDSDVKEFTNKVRVEWKFVDLPDEIVGLKERLEEMLKEVLTQLKDGGAIERVDLKRHKRELLNLRGKLLKGPIAPESYRLLSWHAKAMNLSHALNLVESQGPGTLLKFLQDLETRKKKSKAVRELGEDFRIKMLIEKCRELATRVEHPKFKILKKIVLEEVDKEKKVIVFSHYRETVKKIVEELNGFAGIRAVEFVGKSSGGLSQKKQQQALQEFRDGKTNVLVATSVAEEGLDIPSVDLVVFFEPVPSEIRFIQRRGRVGRAREGRAIILITKGSSDEGFFWSSKSKERKMKELLVEMKRDMGNEKVKDDEEKGLEKEKNKGDFGERSVLHSIKQKNISDFA